MLMYNFVSAFAACLVIILLGEVLSKFTKGWVPSVFISAVLILIAFWTFLPKTLVADSKLLPLGSSVAIFLLITHMGTLFSLERLLQQWKTVVICIAGLAGLVGLCWFVGPLFMDRTLVIAGIPPLAGGIVATTMMQKAALDAGLAAAAVFAIVMYCVQGFAGYPLTAVCLKLEARRQLAAFRAGKVEDKGEDARKVMADALAMPGNESKQGVLATPKAWNTPYFVLLKVSLVAWLAFVLGVLTPVNGAIWALVCGVVFCRLGFLEPNVLSRTGSKDFLFLALIMFVYSGLGDSNPEMMAKLICPMVLLIIIGVVGMAVVAGDRRTLPQDLPLSRLRNLPHRSLRLPLRRDHDRTHLPGGRRRQGRGRLPHEPTLPADDRGRLRDGDDHLRHSRGLLRQALLTEDLKPLFIQAQRFRTGPAPEDP